MDEHRQARREQITQLVDKLRSKIDIPIEDNDAEEKLIKQIEEDYPFPEINWSEETEDPVRDHQFLKKGIS